MLKIVNFFVIGLLAGLAIFYQVHRNRALEQEIQALRNPSSANHLLHGPNGEAGDDVTGLLSDRPDSRRMRLESEISNSRTNAITRAIARTSDAVVGINVMQMREVRNPWLPTDPLSWMLFDERLAPQTVKQPVKNLGSGFIITPDGYIVTNEHVVRDASEIVVTTTAQHKYPARVVGTDPLLDMALLKIDAKDLPSHSAGQQRRRDCGRMGDCHRQSLRPV